MAYVGNKPDVNYTSFQKQDLTGATGGTLTLSTPVTNANDIQLFINHVRQESGTSYIASGTTVTLQGYTVSASDDIYVIYHQAFQTTQPPDGSVGTAKISDDAVTTAKLASGAVAHSTLPSGCILQVLQQVYSDQETTSSGTYSDTGITLAITPKSSSSKILIMISAGLGNTSAGSNNVCRIVRGSTQLVEFERVAFMTSSLGHANMYQTFIWLDSPSTTSATTYKLQYMTSGGALRLNDSNSGSDGESSSTITLMEVVG